METKNYKNELISREVLNGQKFNRKLNAYEVELVVEALLGKSPDLVWDYAMAYISDVDFEELANTVNDQLNLSDND